MLSRKLLVYSVGEMLNKAAAFVFLPVLSIFLEKSEFGAISIFYPAVLALQGVLAFGQPIALIRGASADGVKHLSEWAACAVSVWLVTSLIFGVITIGLINAPTTVVIGGYNITDVLFPIVVSSSSAALLLIVLQVYQYQRDAVGFVLLNSGSKLVFVLAILSLIFSGVGLTARDILFLLMALMSAFSFVACVKIFRLGPLFFSMNRLKIALTVGYPLFLSAILSFLSMLLARSYLDFFHGVEAVADFSFVFVISQMSMLLFAIFVRVFIPPLFSFLGSGGSTRIMDDVGVLLADLSLIATFITSGIILVAVDLTESYQVSLVDFIILQCWVLFYPVYIFHVDTLSFRKRSLTLAAINLIVFLVSLSAGYFFIKEHLVTGAVIVQVLTVFLQSVLVYFLNQHGDRSVTVVVAVAQNIGIWLAVGTILLLFDQVVSLLGLVVFIILLYKGWLRMSIYKAAIRILSD